MGNQPGVAASATPAGGPSPNPLVSFFPVIVICAILYMLVIRPQQRQAKEHRKMVENLKPGDRVMTQGGIFGNVVSLKGSTLIVKIAENVKVEVARSSITQVVTESSNGSPSDKEVVS